MHHKWSQELIIKFSCVPGQTTEGTESSKTQLQSLKLNPTPSNASELLAEQLAPCLQLVSSTQTGQVSMMANLQVYIPLQPIRIMVANAKQAFAFAKQADSANEISPGTA